MIDDSKANISYYIIKFFPFTKKLFTIFPWLNQFVNFSMVGVINMILSYAIYAFLVYIGLHYQVSNLISVFISILNGYLLNKTWVFKKQSKIKSSSQSLRYFLVYGFNILLGILLLHIYVDILHINEYICPIISLPITIPLNYCLNKFWVFRKKEN